jgi:hypothetical protein
MTHAVSWRLLPYKTPHGGVVFQAAWKQFPLDIVMIYLVVS